ncbi:acyltransferase domain-containing protein [Streptomyces sp. V4-01]|uniref:Acyltransferase domain-containing protein n=1 Tax=Actinacidiphila polyblastidii TaxID=3110430 RepID=A0ABU7P8I4_9ACTN|nr:acyltransferase domain-containing protein [Streptomyces sp. V4-01]
MDIVVEAPAGAALADTLVDLAVPYQDVNAVVAARAALDREPDLAELLASHVRELVRDMGVVGGGPGGGPGGGTLLGPPMEPLPGRGPAGHWLPLLVFTAVRPHTLAYHRAHGVPAEVSRRTLADTGRHVAAHRRRHGTAGLADVSWLARHFRGVIYQLGRLQYERTRLGGRTGRAAAAAGLALGPGDPALGVHVPDFSGPLDPGACDESVALAREFFARHFPDESYTIATCHSWLLDPQLAAYLPAGSNIIRFQRRFRPAYPTGAPDDRTTIGFVFGDPELPPDALPARTALERAVRDHLASGGHWRSGNGWFTL